MKTAQIIKHLNITGSQLRETCRKLGIKGNGCGTVKDYSNLEIARIKAGAKYKNYIFVADTDRYWIFYGLSDCDEVTIEI